MPLPIRDGNQSLTTLSTLIVNSAHVPAHTVISLGSQAITDIAQAVSGVELGPNTISALENISVTFGSGASITIGNVVSVTGGLTNAELRASSVTIGGSVQVSNFPATQTTTFSAITGSVSVLNLPATQAVTFTQASVTFGTPVVTGSVSISNFPSTQTIAGTVTANLGEPASGVNTFISESGSTSPVYAVGIGYNTSNDTEFLAVNDTGNNFPVAVNNSVTIGSLPAISGTVTANVAGQYFDGATGDTAQLVNPVYYDGEIRRVTPDLPLPVTLRPAPYGQTTITVSGAVTVGNSVTIGSLPAIAGTVTANVFGSGFLDQPYAVPVMIDGGDSVTRGLNIGFHEDLTADEFRTVKASEPFPVQIRKGTVTIGSLPAISGTVTIGAVSTSVTIAQIQGTSVTTSNFTSTTASQALVSANSARRGFTVFNEGAGNLHICAGVTATTTAYQVRLSAGDYWECPAWQTALTHSAQFASAGTARVVEIS